MVEQKEIIGDYWSQRSEGFSEYVMEHLDEDVQGLYLKTVLSYAEGKKLKVLDVGCGPGLFSVVLGREGHDVTAIDYSDGMIAKARQNCAETGVPANILKMDAQSLEFEDGTFDLIVSRKVVWNLP
ncbi:MAG: class I SAM-dependent methyltransferase, partial [Candidatus Methanomethylophilaceae archaeon]|nr:class I SAM-dependent methyltransferase [Candidatus Methanomethylophilaceae archaeon]